MRSNLLIAKGYWGTLNLATYPQKERRTSFIYTNKQFRENMDYCIFCAISMTNGMSYLRQDLSHHVPLTRPVSTSRLKRHIKSPVNTSRLLLKLKYLTLFRH